MARVHGGRRRLRMTRVGWRLSLQVSSSPYEKDVPSAVSKGGVARTEEQRRGEPGACAYSPPSHCRAASACGEEGQR